MSNEDYIKGGILEIPDGWFVDKVDLDCEEPYIIICDDATCQKEKTLLVPKSLAYYLTTHFCGSEKMKERYEILARNELRNKFKELLEME